MSQAPSDPHVALRSVSLAAASLLLGALLSVALSWPLLPQAGEVLTAGRVGGDLPESVLAQWYLAGALAGDFPWGTWTLTYHPDGSFFLGTLWNVVVLLLCAPLHWVAEPITAYNLSILWLMTLNAAAGALLGQALGGRPGAVLGLVLPLVCGFGWNELFEGHPEQGLVAPAFLVAWGMARLRAGAPRAWLPLGLGMGASGAVYWYLPVLLAVGCLPLLGRTLLRRATWSQLARGALLSVLVAAPFAALALPGLTDGRISRGVANAEHVRFMQLHNAASLRQVLAWPLVGAGSASLPILGVLALVASALRWRAVRPWAAGVAWSLVLAAGPALVLGDQVGDPSARSLPLPFALLQVLPLMDRLWWPERFVAVAVVLLLGGLAVAASQLPARWRLAASLGLALGLAYEGRWLVSSAAVRSARAVRASPLDPERRGFFYERWDFPWSPPEGVPGAVLNFPTEEGGKLGLYHLFEHGRPILSGNGFTSSAAAPASFHARVASNPFLQAWLGEPSSRPPRAEDLEALAHEGVRWILWHLPDPTAHPDAHAEALRQSALVRRLAGEPDETFERLLVWSLATPAGTLPAEP